MVGWGPRFPDAVLHGRSEHPEERRTDIGELDRAPMLFRPRLLDLYFVDWLLKAALADNGNREPFEARGSLDPIAIMPVALCILDLIEYDVFIAPPDQVEESPPGHVIPNPIDHFCSFAAHSRESGNPVLGPRLRGDERSLN